MTSNPATGRPATEQPPSNETEQQRFARILSREEFKPLKDVIDSLRVDRAVVRGAMMATNSYPELLTKLGYRVVMVEQIHVQDSFSRLGPQGGIRTVLPHHDMDTYSTLVTLVNYDSTLTTTPGSVRFFSASLAELKIRLRPISASVPPAAGIAPG